MYSKTLLISAIGFEAGKREAFERGRIACDKTVQYIEQAVDKLDKRFPSKTAQCDGSILCERTGARHKDGCLGRTEPFLAYVKGLQ